MRLAISSLVLVGATGLASAQTYTLVPITEAAEHPHSSPSIGDSGAITFLGGMGAAPGAGIWFASPTGVISLVTGDGLLVPGSELDSLSQPVIDGDGNVAFWGSMVAVDAEGIFVMSGDGTLVESFRSAGAAPGSPFTYLDSQPAIHATGGVAFGAELQAGGHGILTGDDPVADLVADTNGDFAILYPPAINASGQVAFAAVLDTNQTGIFTGPNAVADRYVTSDGYLNVQGRVSINADDTILYTAQYDPSGAGVFSEVGLFAGPDHDADRLVDTTGAYRSLDYAVINDAGEIAFWAMLDAGGSGIFTGPDPVADKVIQVGDVFDGATVNALTFYGALNNAGQLAFSVGTDDGRRTLVRADPPGGGPVDGDPAGGCCSASKVPASGGLLLGVLVAWAIRRRRRG